MKKEMFPIYDIKDLQYSGTEDNFYANTISNHFRMHAKRIKLPHGHTFYVSIFATKGTGTHKIDFTTYDFKPGYIFILFPGQVHNWEISEDAEGYIFAHTREFFDLNFTYEKVDNFPFFSSIHNQPLVEIEKVDMKEVETRYEEILEEYGGNGLMRFQKIASLINVLYIELSRFYIPDTLRAKQNLGNLCKIRELERLIDKNFKTIKSPNKYAEMMCLSNKHLNRMCKATLNKTTTELITDRIMLEAKRMLAHSKHNASEIADELGYSENAYFFRLFKKKTGKTPMEFSKELLKNSEYLSFSGSRPSKQVDSMQNFGVSVPVLYK